MLSVPKRLRYSLQHDPATATAVLHILLRAFEPEYPADQTVVW